MLIARVFPVISVQGLLKTVVLLPVRPRSTLLLAVLLLDCEKALRNRLLQIYAFFSKVPNIPKIIFSMKSSWFLIFL